MIIRDKMTQKEFEDLALSFPGAESRPHFDRTGFRVTGKRMFATYLEQDHSANIFLTPGEQAAFCAAAPGIYPVPNKWGEKGATTFLLSQVPREIVREALLSAYDSVIG